MSLKKRVIASAMVLNDRGCVFVQKRSMTRRLFPGCWDLIGGHVEEDEEIISALGREIHEETGWHLRSIIHELSPKHWVDGLAQYEERQFIVVIDGDLARPTLEEDKVSEAMWVDHGNVERLKENRGPDDQLVFNSVVEALDALQTIRHNR